MPWRRPADAAVWRARLNWAKAADDAAEIERAVRHLPPDRVGPAEILDLRAWFAALAGDADRERKSHDWTGRPRARQPEVSGSPGYPALEAGRRDEADRVRRRQAVLTEIKYRYQAWLQNLTNATIPGAARMAEELGRNFERSAVDAGRQGRPERSCRPRGRAAVEGGGSPRPAPPLIGDLIADLDAMPRRQAAPAKAVAAAVRTPAFLDDAEAAGLRFTFDNGVSSSRHMPETTAGGVGLLDYDGDGWLDVYLPQAGPFPPDLDRPRTEGDRLFRNRGDGTFEDATASAGLAGFAAGLQPRRHRGGHRQRRPSRPVRDPMGPLCPVSQPGDGTFEDATEAWAGRDATGRPRPPLATSTATATWTCTSAITFGGTPRKPVSAGKTPGGIATYCSPQFAVAARPLIPQ